MGLLLAEIYAELSGPAAFLTTTLSATASRLAPITPRFQSPLSSRSEAPLHPSSAPIPLVGDSPCAFGEGQHSVD